MKKRGLAHEETIPAYPPCTDLQNPVSAEDIPAIEPEKGPLPSQVEAYSTTCVPRGGFCKRINHPGFSSR